MKIGSAIKGFVIYSVVIFVMGIIGIPRDLSEALNLSWCGEPNYLNIMMYLGLGVLVFGGMVVAEGVKKS